jgi:uncharacterized membrane protein
MSHSSKERRAQKQQRFAEAHGRKRGINPNVVLTVTGVLLVVALVYLASAGPSKATGTTEVTQVPGAGSNSSQIQIPLSDVSDGQARFYQYKASSGKSIRFFVIKSSDGVYRAAADACVVCYREKKGYHQEGDDMVCNNCRKHFPSALVNEVTGGCNPDGIQRTIQGDKLLIATSDLEGRTELF